MIRVTTRTLLLLACSGVLTACPGQREEHDPTNDPGPADDGTGDGKPPASADTGSAGTPAAPGDGDGDPVCETELERVKAELAACEATK